MTLTSWTRSFRIPPLPGIACLLALAGWAAAAQAAPVRTEHAQAELVAAQAVTVPGTSLRAALRLVHAPGWHSYWRNPGDGGLPTEIQWDLPPGWRAGPIDWPAPLRLPTGPLMNFGYHDTLLLPLTLAAPTDAGPGVVTLAATARWLICAEICVPEEARLTLALTIGAEMQPDPRWALTLAGTDAALPRALPAPAVATLLGRDGRLTLEATIPGDSSGPASFFPDADGQIAIAEEQRLSRRPDGGVTLALQALDPVPQRLSGVLVTDGKDGRQGWIIDSALTAAPAGAAPPAAAGIPAPAALSSPASPPAADGAGLLLAMLGALGGGLLLNLMPCVFPILSLKALSLARGQGQDAATRRSEALAFTLGVLLSFVAIGLTLSALRGGGAALGWGFQLQSPAMVLALAWLMAVMGLNLSGLWQVGGGWLGVGGALAARGGWSGSFATGVLAVLVASPCSAPFMGAALGFALTQPWNLALPVFLALGLGLAAPFLLLGLIPGLARRLPRPGAWMDRLKQALAFPLYATTAWLLWVLAQQAGPDAVGGALIGLVLLTAAGWLWRNLDGARMPTRWLGRMAAALLLAGAVATAGNGLAQPAAPAGGAISDSAERFTLERLAEARAAGRPVLVNATAAWCITCLVNERVALGQPAVRAALAAKGVVYLKADWTRQDPAITTWLAGFGRDGVPLYALYPAGSQAAPEILPQLLTQSSLLARLGQL